MSYNLPNSLCGPNASGDVSFASLGSNYELNSGEGFVGYKSNLGTYYQNAFVIDTNSTVPTVFSSNGNPAFSLNSIGNLVVFGDVSKGTLSIGDTNECNFGGVFTPLGTAYFKQVNIGSTNNNGAALAPVANRHLQLSTGGGFATKFSVANTYTDINNYERLEIGWDSDVATIGPASAGTGSSRNLRLGNSATYLLMKPSDVKWELYTSGVKRVQFGSGGTSFGVSIFPISDSASTCGQDTLRWSNTYTDTLTIGDGVDAITANSKQLKVDVDVSRLIADPDGAGISSFVQLTGGSQWANNTFGHILETEIAPNSQGPSNQVTGLFNQLTFRDSSHTGTVFWAMSSNVSTKAPVNFAGDRVYGVQCAFSNSHFISADSNTEIAGMNCTQNWNFDPTVTGSPTLAGAVFNLDTRALESAGYTHLRVNNASAPTGAGPQFLYGLYIEEQTQAQNAEDNFTILTEGGRSSIKELDTDVFRIYNTFTDFSNYEALEMKFDTNEAVIGTAAAGTGTQRSLQFECSESDVNSTSANKIMSFAYNGSEKMRILYNSFEPKTTGINLGSITSGQRWGTTYTKGISTDVETFTAASDTLNARNNVCLCDCTSNAITLALPVPVAGLQLHIKKIDSTANTVSIEPDDPGPELIDGAIVQTLSSQWDKITLVSDGSNWFTI